MLRFLQMLWLLFAAEMLPDADPEEEDEDEEEDDEEEQRDPQRKIIAQQSHLDRLHKKIRKQDIRIQELEEGHDPGLSEALRSSRVESAFLRAVIDRKESLDVETTWDLANVRGFLDAVQVDADGNVEGIDDALGRVLDRYPWLAEEPMDAPEDDDADPSRPRRTARAPRKRSDAAGKVQEGSLRQRLPALAKGKGR